MELHIKLSLSLSVFLKYDCNFVIWAVKNLQNVNRLSVISSSKLPFLIDTADESWTTKPWTRGVNRTCVLA